MSRNDIQHVSALQWVPRRPVGRPLERNALFILKRARSIVGGPPGPRHWGAPGQQIRHANLVLDKPRRRAQTLAWRRRGAGGGGAASGPARGGRPRPRPPNAALFK